MRYIYEIEMKWVNENGDEKQDEFTIPSVNIISLMMESDFEHALYPVLFAKLNIDKNYIDKMILNGKTGRIYMDIYKKKSLDDPTSTEPVPRLRTQYYGKMQYFFDKDINYNKEIDYGNDINKDRKDINEDFIIGLIFDDCIRYNDQTNNTTIVNSTPFNAILSFMQDVPVLIEPFTYNETIEQIIVPPQESLYKTVDFFNSNKVLYDTPYRFFIDPDCVYLISSAGTGIRKVGEQYDTMTFTIHPVNEEAAMSRGMSTDSENGTYTAHTIVKDTVYNIDNDTVKKYSEFVTIIDGSVNNTLTVLDSVNNTISAATNAITNATRSIQNMVNTCKNIPNQVSKMINNVAYQCGTFNTNYTSAASKVQEAISYIQKMQTTYVVSTGSGESASSETYSGIGTEEDRKRDIAKLQEFLAGMGVSSTEASKLPSEFSKTASTITSTLGDFTRITGTLNGINAISLGDNISSLISNTNSIGKSMSSNAKYINTHIVPLVNQQEIVKSYALKCRNLLLGIRPEEYYIPAGNYTADYLYGKNIQAIVDSIMNSSTGMETSINNVNDIISTYKGYNATVDAKLSEFSPYVNVLQNLTSAGGIDNIKSMVTGGIKGIASGYKSLATRSINAAKSNIVNIGKQAQQSLDSIVTQVTKAKDAAKSLDFGVSDLSDLKQDISIAKDISKIGCLGISSFGTDLNIKDSSQSSTGKKVLRVENDNANMVKNEKARIENKQAKFTIVKADLDISVLTINRKYIIKNYSTHSDKDGLFLLQKRIDIFSRMGEDGFACSTQLDFDKLADIKTKSSSESKNNLDNISSAVKQASSIGKSIGLL